MAWSFFACNPAATAAMSAPNVATAAIQEAIESEVMSIILVQAVGANSVLSVCGTSLFETKHRVSSA
jgi:hypothetical protein